jgi:Domain of Unknown Function (DUF1206)
MTSSTDTLDRGAEELRHPARKARRDAERGRGWYSWLARIGLVAKGVSYGIVGVLAVQLALGGGGKATSRQGALATLADEPLGRVLLAVLAAGFAAYAIWRFVQAFAEREDEGDAKGEAKKWGKRAGYVGRGAIYAGLTFTTLKLLTGSGAGESQNQQAKQHTATVLDWPAGRWIVGLAGLAVAGAGAWNVYRGLARKFEKKWRIGNMSDVERRWGARAGILGHLARGVVFGLIGVFLTKAAIEYDPREAIGLDGALHKLAGTSYGTWLLGLTAVGLICYGLYCLVDARYRDVSVDGGGAEPRPS